VVPCRNKIILDPSRSRRSTVLKLLYFTRGRSSVRVQLRRCLLARGNFRIKSAATACCRLAITVDKCCDWLEQLPHEY